MTIADDKGVYYDPYDVEINADPYPTFRRLRDEAPLYYNERYDFWALSRYDDVEQALVDWQTFSTAASDILELIKAGIELPPGVVSSRTRRCTRCTAACCHGCSRPKRMNALEDQVREFCVRLPRPARRRRPVRLRRRPRRARCRCG